MNHTDRYGSVPARLGCIAALVLLTIATLAGAQPVEVEIDTNGLATNDFVGVGLRGDTAPLAWERTLALADPDGDGVYSATIDFPEGTGIVGYKAVLETEAGALVWEAGANRLLLPGRMTADRRAFGGAQASLPELTVTRAELRDDLETMRLALKSLHPGLRLHNSETVATEIKDRLSARAESLGSRYGDAIPMPAVYLAVAEHVAAIRDGHTRVSMYNQGAYLEAALYARADRAPFTFRLLGGRMVVTGDATPDGSLPLGTEVLSMDGRSVQDVIARLLPYTYADGSNDAKRVKELGVTGAPAPAERFDVIYSLLFDPEGDLALRVRRPDGPEESVAVQRVTDAVRRARLLERDPSHPRSRDDLLRFDTLADGTAYLRIGTFATFNMSTDYQQWLSDAFARMREEGAERLVVDLRGNAGGMDDAAAALLSHLLTEPAEITLWNGVTAYQRVPESVRPHVRSWDSSFLDISSFTTPNGDGTFRMPERGAVTVPSAPDAFRGRAAVIVDAAASSATFYLAQQIKETGAALLVGQQTGGSLKGLNAGQMVFLTLPNTGIVVDIPLFGSRPTAPGPDRGVVPDIVVDPDADALIAGRDAELEAALRALRAGE